MSLSGKTPVKRRRCEALRRRPRRAGQSSWAWLSLTARRTRGSSPGRRRTGGGVKATRVLGEAMGGVRGGTPWGLLFAIGLLALGAAAGVAAAETGAPALDPDGVWRARGNWTVEPSETV